MASAVCGFLTENMERVWTPEHKRTRKPAGDLLLCPGVWVVLKAFIRVYQQQQCGS